MPGNLTRLGLDGSGNAWLGPPCATNGKENGSHIGKGCLLCLRLVGRLQTSILEIAWCCKTFKTSRLSRLTTGPSQYPGRGKGLPLHLKHGLLASKCKPGRPESRH